MAAASLEPEAFLHRFGLAEFRPGQRDVIAAVLAGHDCLCIMPTGGGKSLCYQLPSIARAGTTLVVSPLIALMKDQVDALHGVGVQAAFVNSSLSSQEQTERLLRFSSGGYDLLYVAPERFRSPRFLEAVRQANVQLLAVDEAHCISEWGHDFRHDYARLGEFRQRLGNPQTIALTATATQDVRDDVVKQLNLTTPKTFVAGFARDNLFYRVENHRGKQAKQQALLEFLERTPGCGIIYASTRAGCDEVRDLVKEELRRSIIAYHGGLMPDDRRRLQETFMSGEAEIVAATNAFGMGIDKPDVRFVLHYNIPGSLEAYYQEAGRAGRDGQPAECLLLYSQNDRFVQEFFIDSAHPPKESIKEVYDYLCQHPADPIELTQQELKQQLDLSIGSDGVGNCERLLEKAGVLERLDSHRNMAAVRVDTDAPNLAELLPTQAKVQRRIARAVGAIVRDQRYERVYFHPADVSTLCGDDVSSVTRYLRELSRNDWFDYVPPFRGRAVHMLRRDLPFHELDIDYTRLEERRKSNLGKLDRIVRFATTRGCRQRDILRYFGEATSDRCGHCDNCVAAGPHVMTATITETGGRQVTPAMTEMARIILSGVARAQGRFGKTLVVGMLCGSRSAKIVKWKLDALSTFGLLNSFKQTEVTEVLDALVAFSLIKSVEVDKFRPTVTLTDEGIAVMRGNSPLPLAFDLEPSLMHKIEQRFRRAQPPASIPSSAVGSRQADQAASSEVFADLAHPPTGPSSPAHAHVQPQPDPNSSSPAVYPTHYWTWRLFNDGYALHEVAAIRGVSRSELCGHLVLAAEQGQAVDPGWIIDPGHMDWLAERFAEQAERRLVASELPAGLTSQLAELFKKCQRTSAAGPRINA